MAPLLSCSGVSALAALGLSALERRIGLRGASLGPPRTALLRPGRHSLRGGRGNPPQSPSSRDGRATAGRYTSTCCQASLGLGSIGQGRRRHAAATSTARALRPLGFPLQRQASPGLVKMRAQATAADKVAVAEAEGASDVAVAAGEEQAQEGPKEIFLKDYKPPVYAFVKVDLAFDLYEDHTTVLATVDVKPWEPFPHGTPPAPLVLDGDSLELVSLAVNGVPVPDSGYKLTKKRLEVLEPPSGPFQLSIVTKIDPANNTALEGLYKSSGNFCTQCEAEGFRRITFFQDRPDVMAKYTTRIQADKEAYPVLLSNGNLVEEGELEGGRHYAVWEDPWPKPSYLFALVAGRLVATEDTFKTGEGRDVTLRIWVQPGDEARTGHAMRSLKASMLWDEQVFGLHYDLDLFNIVAVPDFNMGAMENKSLNIFNSRLILASPETASDADYSAIEGVVAHEYFHNWTGNRVTCRDWFQLTLKEGLTVYRDQEFSSDMNNQAVARIGDVVRLRASQFSQDAGPMAHPVRPLSYIKMDNFYTVTVYEKGAEVVRMYETLLGKDGFRKGMDLYFQRHDGQAVTCDDFLAAMRDANDANLEGFSYWLSQAGTPLVRVTSEYNAAHKTFSLKCRQELPNTPGQPSEQKQPMLIPLRVGLLRRSDGSGVPLTAVLEGDRMSYLGEEGSGPTSTVLRLTKSEQEFTFTGIEEPVVPSLLRGFSAPVRLQSDLTREDQLFLLANDPDDFNRWEACQAVARELMLSLVEDQQQGRELALDPAFIKALEAVLTNTSLDKAFVARILALPGETEVAELMSPADPDAIHAVAKFCRKTIASELRSTFEALVKENEGAPGEPYSPDHESKARRALKNTSLSYLASLNDTESTALAVSQFQSAANMTDQFGALAAVAMHDTPERAQALSQFYEQWKHDGLVMNKWLSLQASSSIPGNVEAVRQLKEHPAFNITEPNKVYSLMGGFASCPVNFHALDGSGYKFIADSVIELDKLNAQVAARIVSAFTRWRNYDQKRQELAKAELERIKATQGLSENVFEIVSKTLS